MSTNLSPTLASDEEEPPLALTLSAGHSSYRIVLPHAGTDYIQKKLAADRVPYGQQMLDDMRSRVSPDALVLDIGANIGHCSLYLAAVAGCRVESFEADPELCAALRESIALNEFAERLRLHEVRLGREEGVVRTGDGGLHVHPLDSFRFDGKVEAIKLGVTGMEIDVLEGAGQLLQRDRPLIYVECGSEAHYRRVLRWMAAKDYAHWDTFDAAPTHLFIPGERLSVEQLLHLQVKAATDDGKSNRLLREVRERLSQTQQMERDARVAMASAQAQEREARAALADAQARGRETQAALAITQKKEREARTALTDAQTKERRGRAAVAEAKARASEALATLAEAQASELQTHSALVDMRTQERELRAALADAQAREQQTHRALMDMQAQEHELRAALGSERDRLKRDAARLRQELGRAKRSIEDLGRSLDVRELKLAATKKRAVAFAERLQVTRESASFQIGQALIAAGRSLRGALRLPLELGRIYRNAKVRRTEDTASVDKARPEIQPAKPAGPKPAAVDAVMPLALRDPARLPAAPAMLKSLRVAGIMDEFTHHSFASECELLPLRLASWQADLEAFKPDLVFIESAWRGAEGDWSLKISNPSEALALLIGWAQERRVPTIFWNKEDPVHFDGFLHVARAVDYVFTTDIDCIARYKREVGHDRVYLLPFAAQPASHNPIERFPRADAFCFAGSYYLKYPERQRDFRNLLDAIQELKPVEIFDRNFDKPHPHYEFPPEYRPYIKGNLPFDQIDKAYKGYRYGVNMNTIKQSQTMFARRVFELLASNTVVVSNFSRGMRLLFGDLVIASDASAEIRRRLEPLEDETSFRKFRLAGLRKVMSQHTYAQRLAYIAEKLGASAPPPASAGLCVLAFPADAQQARAIVSGWRRQSLGGTHLCLVGTEVPAELLGGGVSRIDTARDLGSAPVYAHAKWIAPLMAADYHGPHYLFDLLQATSYCNATVIGKASHFRSTGSAVSPVELVDRDRVYRPAEALQARCSILSRERFEGLGVVDGTSLEAAVLTGEGLMAIDEFNYALGATEDAAPELRLQVDDLPNLRHGLDLHAELLAIAERIAPAAAAAVRKDDVDALPGLSAEDMAAAMPQHLNASLSADVLVIPVRVPADKHRYVYLQRSFLRAELNLETNSRVHLICEYGDAMEVRTVFEYLDANGQKISHTMAKAGQAHSLAIPAACRSVRFGLRLVGRGELRIRRLVSADVRERPTALVGTAKHLAVLKQYPDYSDLYKYGFVHSRLRAYRRHGVACDVFRLTNEEPYRCREFENIDVTAGDWDLLDLALQGGNYQHVLVHLMDKTMWEVIQRHIDRVRVTVWLHGAEVQAWQRRAFEFEGMDSDEISRKKRLGEQRLEFWRGLLAAPHPNLHLVFVSQRLADEVATDLGIDLSSVRHSVIHNFIDPDMFPYVRKLPEDRLRLLSIRPFVSRAYANDLTVKALQAIADEPWFNELQVTIVGDGERFEDITRPLADMANVNLMRRFLTQNEIAALHRQHGVFLSPTRMDTQGVSRDEAMSSGLVPITNAVAAVPEFVAEDCGFLAAAEDYEGLAAAIRQLRDDPQRFLAMSDAAAKRVRSQSGFDQTIGRELALIAVDRGATP